MLALRFKKAVRDGATLIVADPRKIWLTKLAKRHLQLRPGTDVWLLNAMMHTILEEGLQDEEFIREHTEDFDVVREVVSRYTPEAAAEVTGVPAEDIRWAARAYAGERHAAIFYTLGITEHACAVDNIWSLSNLVLMTGHLGYESTGLNALRGQNNVQGLNDAGANPAYLPGYQPANDPEIRAKFAERWGVEVPETPGYRLDQMISGMHDGRIRAFYLIGENPAHTEPNAAHVEHGLDGLDFLVSPGHLPERVGAKVRGRRPPRLELRREGGDVHEHRAAREPRAPRRPAPGQRARGPADRDRPRAGAGRRVARVRRRRGRLGRVRRPRAALERHPLRPPRGGRAPVALPRRATTRGRRTSTRRARRARAGRASSSRSSTSRRSRSPTPSSRSSSRPAGRSTTTTRPG